MRRRSFPPWAGASCNTSLPPPPSRVRCLLDRILDGAATSTRDRSNIDRRPTDGADSPEHADFLLAERLKRGHEAHASTSWWIRLISLTIRNFYVGTIDEVSTTGSTTDCGRRRLAVAIFETHPATKVREILRRIGSTRVAQRFLVRLFPPS